MPYSKINDTFRICNNFNSLNFKIIYVFFIEDISFLS